MVIWRDADEDTRERVPAQIGAEPGGWIGQELVELSVHPTVVEGGLEPRHVDLRPFALLTGEGARVLPACISRVALERGSMVVNSGQGGEAKGPPGSIRRERRKDVLGARAVLAHEPYGTTGLLAAQQLHEPPVLHVRVRQHHIGVGHPLDQVADLPLDLGHRDHEPGEWQASASPSGSAHRHAGRP